MNRKFVTVLMTACLIVTLFAGCGGKDQDALSTGPNAGASSTQEPGTVTGADAAIPGESQNADEQAGGTAAANPQGSSGQTTNKNQPGASPSITQKRPGSSVPGTARPNTSRPTTTRPGTTQANSKKDIVEYFNKAANKVKTGKPGLKYDLSMSMSLGIPGFPTFDETDSGSVRKGASLNKAFPVAGKSWASQLSYTAVKSATRTLSNGKYTIKIVLNTEKGITNVANSAHGKVFTVMDLNEINDSMQEEGMQMKTISNTFHDSSITCVVDAKSGNMLSATYTLNDTVSATLVAEGMEIPLTNIKLKMVTSYTMDW